MQETFHLVWQVSEHRQLDVVSWSKCSHLGLLLLCGINDRGAADLSQLAALTVKGPTADLVPDHIFDEEDAAVEAERQSVKQLNVLQQVVVRVTAKTKAKRHKKEVPSSAISLSGLWLFTLWAWKSSADLWRRNKSIISLIRKIVASGGQLLYLV